MEKTIKGTVIVATESLNFELYDQELVLHYDVKQIGAVTTAKETKKGHFEFLGTEQVSQKVFYGTTSTGKKIAFKVAISKVDYFRNRIICSLDCCYILEDDRVNCLTIISEDIHQVVKNYKKHEAKVSKEGIEIPFEGDKHFYTVELEENKKIEFACYEAFKTYTNNKKPVEFIGQIQIVFQTTSSIEELFRLVELARSFIIYLTYRRDIIFDEILIGDYSDNKFKSKGSYLPFNNPERVSSQALINTRLIPIELVDEIIPQLLYNLYNDTIYVEHMRIGMTKTHVITGGDIVTLTAGFEYEFDKSGITIPQKESEVKQRNYIKEQYGEILNSDKLNAYGRSTVKNAIKHIDDLLLETKLNAFFKTIPNYFLEAIESIFKRLRISFKVSNACHDISEARNKIAHGEISFRISRETIYEFLIMEMLVYFVQLKRLGLDELKAFDSISSLFDIG